MNEELQDEAQNAAPERRARKRSAPWLLGGLVLVLLSVLVVQQVSGLWDVLTPERAADTLLLYALSSLNFAAFIVFTFIFVRSLLKLRRERRERQLGSKIKTRLVVYFITVSLLPITAMAVFSFIFLNRSLEKWFGHLPEDVVNEARAAQREEADQGAQAMSDIASAIAVSIDRQLSTGESPDLASFVEREHLASLEILSADGSVLEKSDAAGYVSQTGNPSSASEPVPPEPNQSAEGLASDGKFDIASVPLSEGRILLATRARQSNSRLARIIAGSETYEQLRRKQRKVRLLGLSTLGLLTLMLLFAATWSAIHLARGIATPIRALAEAAGEITRGNLAHRVTAIADDELALLAESFNAMTSQLAENRRRIETAADELRDKNLALEERREYIETVLESLSTGVVSLDENNCMTTINAAALVMLRLESTPPAGATLARIVSAEDYTVLERVLARARRAGRATLQTELARGSSNGGVPVALTATALNSRSGQGRGIVLVMEDLSELLAAQRAAAWSEVARRMAHEIKNPLTPIQLSAERIARYFHRHMDGDLPDAGANGRGTDHTGGSSEPRVAQIVDECTATITREVAGLKAMVDEFSRFARLPHARLESGDLNEVARQAVSLYEDRLPDVTIDVRWGQRMPEALLDAEQIRRVFVNLIDNALEALADAKEEGERRITIATGYDPARGLLLAEVADTGHGIERADYPRLFQPYFSTRGRGTGLGLAIVQRIITEHGGRIRVEANHPRGAKFTIELPALDDGRGREASHGFQALNAPAGTVQRSGSDRG